MPDDALTHIERFLADTYRREIEQEENIWRSLPFFAATLALELAALFQIVDRLPRLPIAAGRLALGLIAISGLSSLAALGFLTASIWPARFRYIADDVELLAFARDMIALADEPANQALTTGRLDAHATLLDNLAEQYADATDRNRLINRRRLRRRSIAGMATIAAIVSTLLLVATVVGSYLRI